MKMIGIPIILVIAIAIYILTTHNALSKAKNRLEFSEQELAKYEADGDADDIDNARKYYNAVLRDYNLKVDSFPSSLVAELFNFPKMHSENFDEGL